MSSISVRSHVRPAFLFVFLFACALLSAWPGAAFGDTGVTDMDEGDYQALGFKPDSSIPGNAVPPYPVAKATEFFVHNEVYLAANGPHGNQYYLRDRLTKLTGPGGESNVSDSYGALRGAYAIYHGINKMSSGNEDRADRGGGRSSYLSDNESSHLLASGSNGFSGIYAQSVAYKNEAGPDARDTSIAELRAYGATSDVTLNGSRIEGAMGITLFNLVEDGRRVSQGTSLALTINASQVSGNSFKYLKCGYLQELEGAFDLIAADVDGDGADELVCWCGAYEDSGSTRNAIINLFRHDGRGGPWSAYEIRVYAGNAGDYSCATQGNKDESSWHQLQSTPVVTLAAGDLDRDGKEDVAITVSAPYGKSNVSSARTELYTWRDGALRRIEDIVGAKDGHIDLAAPGDAGKAMVSANCAMGTFREYTSGGTPTERTVTGLIIGGYESLDARYHYGTNSYFSRAGYRYVYYDKAEGGLVVSDYKSVALDKDGRRIVQTAAMKSDKSYRYACTLAPIALGCANLKGMATSDPENDAVLLAGDIYQQFACTIHAGNANGLGICTGHLSICNKHYNQSNIVASKDTEQVWIGEVATGCVSGADSFNESFLAVVGIHRDEGCGRSDDYYWMDVSHATITGGKLVSGQEGVICESNRRGKTYGTFISLCLPNVLKNGVRATYVTHEKVYTNPQVLAVLQEVPYFQELQDSFRYRSVGSTNFGTGSSTSTSDGFSFSGSVGGFFDAELGFLGGGKFDFEIAPNASYDFQALKSVSFSTTYASGSSRGNQAVVYTLPMIYYHYDVTNEATGETAPLVLTSSLGAQTSVVSVAVFDEIARKNNMTPISAYLTNTSGQPGTYVSRLSGENAVEDSFGLGKHGVKRAYTSDGWSEASTSGGSSISRSIDASKSYDQSFGIGLSINSHVGGGIKLFGNKVIGGIVFNLAGGYTHMDSSSKSTVFSATVDNLPEAAQDNYGFTWRLGVNKLNRQEIGDDMSVGDKDLDGIWLIGYDLKSVETADAPAVGGFAVRRVDSHSVELRWDDVLDPHDSMRYGIGMLDASGSYVTSYRLVDPKETSYVWDGLLPDHTYRFMIVAAEEVSGNVEVKGIRSPEVVATTLPSGMTFTVAGPQANPSDLFDHTGIATDSSVLLSEGEELTLACFASVRLIEERLALEGAQDEASDKEGETGLEGEEFLLSEDTGEADGGVASGETHSEFEQEPSQTESFLEAQAEGTVADGLPTYIWYKKARGDKEWQRVQTRSALSPEEVSVLSAGAVKAADDGTQYYCRVGYNDYSLDSATIMVGVADEGEEAGTLRQEVASEPLPSHRMALAELGQAFLERLGFAVEIHEVPDAEPADEEDQDDSPSQPDKEHARPDSLPQRGGGLEVAPWGAPVPFPYGGTYSGSTRETASDGSVAWAHPAPTTGVAVEDPAAHTGGLAVPSTGPTQGVTGGVAQGGATSVPVPVATQASVPAAKEQALAGTGDRVSAVPAVLAIGLASLTFGLAIASLARRRD